MISIHSTTRNNHAHRGPMDGASVGKVPVNPSHPSCPSPAGGEAVGLAILHRKALAGTLAVQGRTARVVDRPAGNAAVTLEGS